MTQCKSLMIQSFDFFNIDFNVNITIIRLLSDILPLLLYNCKISSKKTSILHPLVNMHTYIVIQLM